MRAYERLVADDGYEVLLFPLEYMYMSQDEGGDYSHQGTLSMDFLGWGENGRVYQCEYYAPCTCSLVLKNYAGAYNIWESSREVHTPLGLTKVCFLVAHDDNLPYTTGDVIFQGNPLGATGTSGDASGDHVHLNVAIGEYDGQEQVPPNNNWQLKNSRHIYDMMYVNDTVIVEGYGHDWLIYSGGIGSPKKSKFPWVLYCNKLRNKRRV